MNQIKTWREEHQRFATLLDTIEAQLSRFHRGERPDYSLMLEVMRYMRHYPDASHHPREDLAFAKVAEREPNSRKLVDELAAEHGQIERAGQRLVELLEEVLDDAVLARHEVEEPGREYISHLRTHMRREELLFPFVAMCLEAKDWDEIDRELPPAEDPLLRPHDTETYQALQELVALPQARKGRRFVAA